MLVITTYLHTPQGTSFDTVKAVLQKWSLTVVKNTKESSTLKAYKIELVKYTYSRTVTV